MNPLLTSVREFPEELGKHLAEFVVRRIQEPDREPQQLTIPTRVVVRESTRALSAGKAASTRRDAGIRMVSKVKTEKRQAALPPSS